MTISNTTFILIVFSVVTMLYFWFFVSDSKLKRILLPSVSMATIGLVLQYSGFNGFVSALVILMVLGIFSLLIRIPTYNLIKYGLFGVVFTLISILLNSQILASQFSRVSYVFFALAVIRELIYDKVFEE